MPIAHVYILEGRDDEQKSRVLAAVTQALTESLDVRAESVRVIIHEVPKSHWGVAGEAVSKRQ
jgi:4-oxalocrotonate tautomerase